MLRTSFVSNLLASLLLASSALGQSASSEDIVELSPFQVSADPEPAYKSAEYLGRVRVPTPLIDPRSAYSNPSAPVGVLKRADAVAVQFVLSHSGDKQEVRNQELYASVTAIETALRQVKGAKAEQREVRFTGGDRRFFSVSAGGATTSFVSILVLADLPPDTRVADRVKEIRDVLAATKLAGRTKYSDGSIGLYLRNPDQYRREILQKVFDDVAFMKKGFADDFEILPTGLTGRVKLRVVAEAEIELWIDYSFAFRSVREIAASGKK
jgi:hypothetical protein